jgi:ABC-type methionine transport system ATPase subunit
MAADLAETGEALAGEPVQEPDGLAEAPAGGGEVHRCPVGPRQRRDCLVPWHQHREDQLPSELSGGQQQRVAIARALVKEPKVLLAYEPTGNLDEDTHDDIIALLEKLWRERGLTRVLVTHDSSIARRAERIAVMKQGRLSIRQDTRRRVTT